MNTYSKYNKILILIFALGVIVWLGGNVIRTVIAFDLFIPGKEMEIKQTYSDELKMHSVLIYSNTSIYTNVCYGLAVVSFFLILGKIKENFKEKGWLFMASILFVFTIPVELYSIIQDIYLALAIHSDNIKNFNDIQITQYFTNRYFSVSYRTFSSLSFLASVTAILYLVFQPLSIKKIEVENNESRANN